LIATGISVTYVVTDHNPANHTMLLNRVEYALMNNPIRGAIQRHFEARRLLRMGGPMSGGQLNGAAEH
jgi:hypothetical protein